MDLYKPGMGQKLFMACHLDNMIPPEEAEIIVKERMRLRRRAKPEMKAAYDRIWKDSHGRYIRPRFYGNGTKRMLSVLDLLIKKRES